MRAAKAAAAAAALVVVGSYVYARSKRRKRTVVITGGRGNLATKLATHLRHQQPELRVLLLEHPDFAKRGSAPPPDGAIVVLADLADPHGAWCDALDGAYALVHFSAVNPYPNASWEESASSMSHTFNVFLAAKSRGVRRVIFASSNHVMGGYKDLPDHGAVTPACPPRCGTLLHDPADRAKSGDAVAYAAAKLAGEQLARSLAAMSGCTTTFAALRIGWCQPGENHPSTLNPSGSPPQFQTQPATEAAPRGGTRGSSTRSSFMGEDADTAWFKGMWLSNRDFTRYFEAALDVPIAAGELLIVNAMSRNTGMRWSLDDTARRLNVVALDDSRAS